MSGKKSFGAQLEAFFEGKGFYIVLLLCAAVIGVSAWVLMMGTNVEDEIGDIRTAGVVVSPAPPKPSSAPSPAPVPSAKPAPTPVALPESENLTEVWNESEGEGTALFVWPVNGEVLTPYAVDRLLYDATMEDWRVHGGVDIAAPLGAQVAAVSNGVVTAVLKDDMYGTSVIISHSDGVESIYSNLAAQPTVSEGSTVTAGEVIGAVGDTAVCESAVGTHLHFSMRCDGNSTDPANYLP
jgi:murein DD-endopeptidase MepM/ murein hydrolase activator NlpD